MIRHLRVLLCILLYSVPSRSARSDSSIGDVPAGMRPRAIAVNPVTNLIYVANEFSNSVTVIDGANNSAATVMVGSGPVHLAVNPVTNKIYVTNNGSANVTVI